MTTMATSYVSYSPSVEVAIPDEERVFNDLATSMVNIAQRIGDQARHSARAVHAKSHGLLRAQFVVDANLPQHLRQGLFSHEGPYPAIMRFSTNPGDMLSDSISTPRGLAVKVVGVEGEMVEGHQGNVTQDFVFVNAKAFSAPDAAGFLDQVHLLEKHATDSVAFKQVVSTSARLAEETLEAVGQESGLLKGFGHPQTHILGETFASVAALRYGDYVAKIAFVPGSSNLKALTGKHLENANDYSAIRDAVVKFFEIETAVWDVKVQLSTDLATMPVEDASVQWSEEISPYIRVGTLTAYPQDAYSFQRRAFVDESLSFNPWHGLVAHQPLGNIMRARKKAY